MGGDSTRLRTRTRVARHGRPPWGWKGTGPRAKTRAQWRGGGGRLPCSPTSSTSQRSKLETTDFPGRPHSAALSFSRLWARTPPPRHSHWERTRDRPALGGCDCCPTRLRGPFGAARSRERGWGQVSPQPPRAPATAAGSERTEPGRDPPPLSQTRVRARKTLSL